MKKSTLEHRERIISALKKCGAEDNEIGGVSRRNNLAKLIGDESVFLLDFLEKAGIPVKRYVRGGEISEEGWERIRASAKRAGRKERADELFEYEKKHGSIYPIVTLRDIDDLINYENQRGER